MKSALPAALLLLTATAAPAVDTVNRAGGEDPVAGTITDVSKDAITVNNRVRGDTLVPANEVESVVYETEPPELALARTAEKAGRTQDALEKLSAVLAEVKDNAPLRGEVEFLIARAKARAGEADAEARPEAVAALQAFVDSGRGHYRYYPALLRLGRLKALSGETVAAEADFRRVGDSGFSDYEMAASVAAADAKFASGDLDAAASGYASVVARSPKTPGETSRRLAALLGQAKVETARKNYDAAVEALDEVIDNTTAEDTAVQAEAYLRQGDAYAAQGSQAKAAVMAYLHVDVIPSLSREAASHAEALYRLATLWPAVGRADRGAEAAARLREAYPNSEWAGKL